MNNFWTIFTLVAMFWTIMFVSLICVRLTHDYRVAVAITLGSLLVTGIIGYNRFMEEN